MKPPQDPPSPQDLQALVDRRMAQIPFSRVTGMKVTAVEPGRASLVMPARPAWCGDLARNRVHTGCLCALADTACGFAVGSEGREVGVFSTLDLRMDYLRSADGGQDLFCTAHCHRMSRSVAFVRGEVRQADSDDVIALVNATFMRSASRPSRGTPAGNGAGSPQPVPPPDLSSVSAEALLAASLATAPALPEGRSPYVDFLGVVVHPQVHTGPIFRLPFREDLIGNPRLPALHGGVLAGFGETAMVLHLAAAHGPMGRDVPKAVDFSIDYLRPARPMDTFAQGVTIRLGNRVSLVQASLWQDDPRRPVAATRGHLLMPNRD